MRTALVLTVIGTLLAAACSAPEPPAPEAGETERAAGELRRVGTIELDVSCSEEVRQDFEEAVALLHSFFYDEARRRFHEIAERDETCAMAWWGVAMTHYHPLWSPPSEEEMAAGTEAVRRAKAIGGTTPIERGLIAAIDAFYRTDETRDPSAPIEQSCHGPRAHGARAAAFRDSLGLLRDEYPDELEVSAFHALSVLGTAPPTDKAYTNQIQAATMLESLMERNPDHPGLAHYIIHAYDYPDLAERALPAARVYDDIAPWVPHALHMPTHVYTRLGMWDESIAGNRASSAAARAYSKEHHGGKSLGDDLHAMDYLMYAYVQSGRIDDAADVLEEVRAIEAFHPPKHFAAAYAVTAIPARFHLEREDFAGAAVLEVLHPELVAEFPFAEAHVLFARAVGAARSNDVATARAAVGRLGAVKERLSEPRNAFWKDQVEIQRLAASGWLAYAEGDPKRAEKRLREAAALEDAAGTHPVAPGQILPAREQLADLLLELGRPAEALAEYEASSESFPNRRRASQGMERAKAALAG